MMFDQITVNGVFTDEHMWTGNLGYNLPIGSSGLRGRFSYGHTYYRLGKDFASLDASGTADIASAGLSYPILRSQMSNLSLSTSFQQKRLNDKQGLTGTSDSKSSGSVPVALSFDHRDGFGGAGITYGMLSYTTGHLNLDTTLAAQDRASGRLKAGQFDKWNLDIARIQTTPFNPVSIYLRSSAQLAGKNLDSSEGFLLGGPNGVRAYPSSEGAGDQGWLGQLEVRYAYKRLSPFAFYDAGRIWLNARTASLTTPVLLNTRTLAGQGVGIRIQQGPISLDTTIAWRSEGGTPQSDSKPRTPALWMALVYHY